MPRRFTREELAGFRDATVPDLVGDSPRLVFVGINPGLWTAATQTHFSYPGNRFYPALHLAGLTDDAFPSGDGLDGDQRRELVDRGIAITNFVRRATARADELSADELRSGGEALGRRLAEWAPRVVAVLGITAYRTAFGARTAERGLQADGIGSIATYVFGNPSGLNAHETVDTLAASFREAAVAAGIEPVR